MSVDNRILAALDIGSNRIRALIAQAFDDDAIYCLGYAETPAEGIRRGVIINMEKVTRAISRVVEEAETQANVRVDSILVGISGDHIRSINSHGAINVSRSDDEITMRDMQHVADAARDVAIPTDREIIHVISQEFTVDNQPGIRNPIGMNGSRLEVETHIVTCASASAKNIFRALERCDVSLSGFALESYVASWSSLKEEEMELGVALVDIGGEATEIAVYKNGCIRHSSSVPLGGQNITNDIAIGLRITVDEAERLKISYGNALPELIRPNEMMEVSAVGGRPARTISRSVLATIIEARAEEIFSLVSRELQKIDFDDGLAAGVTLIGAGARMPGLVDLAEQTLNLPAKVAHPIGVENMPNDSVGPQYATIMGLIMYAAEEEIASLGAGNGLRGALKKIEGWLTGQF